MPKAISLLLFNLLLSCNLLIAQKEANHWYFGDHVGLNFSSNQPIFDSSSIAPTSMGCASISDSSGNLLFYTNGGDVSFLSHNWNGVVVNRNHQVMPNGHLKDTCETGSNFQSSIIIPKVGSVHEYYLFTVDGFYRGQNKGLRYSIIDMNEDNGLGDVTIKGSFIDDTMRNGIVATKHQNNIDYWLIARKVPKTFGGKFYYYAYKIDSNGINPPVISIRDSLNQNSSNTCKLSPNGRLFYSGNGVYNFDKQTGNIYGFRSLGNGSYNCAEFSSNSRFLYTTYMGSSSFYIHQFDLSSNNIISTKTAIDSTHPYNSFIKGTMQLGPNGKIYVSHVSSSSISVIDEPDSIGLSCNYQRNQISLMGKSAWWEFPNFPSSFFYSNQITTTNSEITKNRNISIYPNPSAEFIQIKGINDPIEYIIYNMQGVVQKNGFTSNLNQINISSLENGLYIISDKKTFNKKFIKQ